MFREQEVTKNACVLEFGMTELTYYVRDPVSKMHEVTKKAHYPMCRMQGVTVKPVILCSECSC